MPKKHYEPEKLIEVDGVTVWHTYKAGGVGGSDMRYGWIYTLDAEEAEVDCGTGSHFDVRNLPMFTQIPACTQGPDDDDEPPRSWEMGHHAAVILAQLIVDPSKIPQGEDWVP